MLRQVLYYYPEYSDGALYNAASLLEHIAKTKSGLS
jgi:hypothetical protein